MATTTNIVKGLAISFKHGSWIITDAQFVNPGKGGAFTRTKIKNLKTGQVIEQTFRSGEALELIDLQRTKCQFLYKDNNGFHFMNNESYEQFSLQEDAVTNGDKFLIDGTECYAMYIDGIPVSIQMPAKMDFKVISAPPGLKGDTATGGSKDIEIETGAIIKAPLFIKEGEKITVNTEDGTYVSKATA